MDYKAILQQILDVANKNNASDIHLKANSAPYLRINGELREGGSVIPDSVVKELVFTTMTDGQRQTLLDHKELDYAFKDPIKDIRYRINAYTAQGKIEAVLRIIKSQVFNAEALGLPRIVDELALTRDGLILVAGATGQGKTTTLAAMIDRINHTYQKRIITIENPVEILHKDDKAVISQREVGGDTDSFTTALRSVLRQNPDVILIGEIRDQETADIALQASMTGHLVFATIHAGTAEEAIKRFANLYPVEERGNVKKMLAHSVRGILAQRLLRDINGNKLAAVEIMTQTDRITQALLAEADGQTSENITRIISESNLNNMITMDQVLVKLALKKVISTDTALAEAVNEHAMRQELHRRGLA